MKNVLLKFVLAICLTTMAIAQYPLISSLNPADDSINVSVDTDLIIIFNIIVHADSGNIIIKETATDSVFETIPVGNVSIIDSIVTINPTNNFEFQTSYYVILDSTVFHDGNNNFFVGIHISKTWNFVTQNYFTDINAGLIDVKNSSVAWGDYDNDGDLDILLTGFISYNNYISKIYRNDPSTGSGRAFTDINAGLVGVSNSSVAWGDYDNDGDLDILLTGNSTIGSISRIYRNDPSTSSSRTFTDINAGLPGVISGSVAWGDYDNDGDLDILLTGLGISRIYRNDPSTSLGRTFTDINAGLTGVSTGSATWGDYDNDGDLDILLTGSSTIGSISCIYRNDPSTGSGRTFTDINAGLTGVNYSSVAWGDYDNDGDLDILLTGYIGSWNNISKIYQNNSGIFIDINAGLTGIRFSSVAWGDYDNDGDLDILLSGSYFILDMDIPFSRIYRNDSGIFNEIDAGLNDVLESSVVWGDYDNDGDLDILLTGDDIIYVNTVSKIYRNNSTNANTIPLSPDGLNANVSTDSLIFSWNKAIDLETPQDGLSYNLFLGNSVSGSFYKPPMADVNNGYRHIPAIGNAYQVTSLSVKIFYFYPQVIPPDYWGVQALDHGFAGSPFATDSLNLPHSPHLQLYNNNVLGINDSIFIEPIYIDSIISYRIQIDDDSLFNTPEIDDSIYTHNNSLHDISGNDTLINFTHYYWRIKPHYIFGLPTVFSNQPAKFLFRTNSVLIDTLNINLSEGWNMIGGPNWDLMTYDIIDSDSLIIPNTFYRYVDYYVATDTIVPGYGYWVMSSDSGQISMIRGHFGSPVTTPSLLNPDQFTSFQISDNNGHFRKLYLNSNEEEIENPGILKSYALPPVTNQNMFDVRFANGKYLCEGSETTIELQSSEYPIEINISKLPQSDKFSYVLQEINGEEIIKTHDLRNGETLIISQPQSNNSSTLKITKQSLIPETFSLGQNYPNPFNPVTTIPYALPEKAKVKIELYDMLGRKIKTLLNTEKDAGFHNFEFNVDNLATGVYIYRIQASQFSAKKKLLLMK